ncbi:uncharacterized protein KGF55_004647 [Candida pseudojiufengensis]|uniref:uncharacterized protein n=1 Tax=Candida pseudojiufengensis TaxID=497109 RepID=UPI002223F2FC|nr:uncharacterized protein KGF55_004647 [Candida pseudojiufengensis]KAI5960355.1 hypothetical protein KGF55_004647 [Candida pseudojiufengensis]
MNKIKQINQINQKELKSTNTNYKSSWHYDYRDTNYIYIGNIPTKIKYKDIIIIFSQFGIPTHLNLITNKEPGTHKGFAFLKYSNFKSCILAIDNFNGIKIFDKFICVDHNYYKLNYGEKEDDYLISYDEIMKEIDDEKGESLNKEQKLITDNEKLKEDEENEVKEEIKEDDEFADPLAKLLKKEDEDEFVDPMESFTKSKSKEKKSSSSSSHKSRSHRSSRHKSHRSSRREKDSDSPTEDRVREKSPERSSDP